MQNDDEPTPEEPCAKELLTAQMCVETTGSEKCVCFDYDDDYFFSQAYPDSIMTEFESAMGDDDDDYSSPDLFCQQATEKVCAMETCCCVKEFQSYQECYMENVVIPTIVSSDDDALEICIAKCNNAKVVKDGVIMFGVWGAAVAPFVLGILGLYIYCKMKKKKINTRHDDDDDDDDDDEHTKAPWKPLQWIFQKKEKKDSNRVQENQGDLEEPPVCNGSSRTTSQSSILEKPFSSLPTNILLHSRLEPSNTEQPSPKNDDAATSALISDAAGVGHNNHDNCNNAAAQASLTKISSSSSSSRPSLVDIAKEKSDLQRKIANLDNMTIQTLTRIEEYDEILSQKQKPAKHELLLARRQKNVKRLEELEQERDGYQKRMERAYSKAKQMREEREETAQHIQELRAENESLKRKKSIG